MSWKNFVNGLGFKEGLITGIVISAVVVFVMTLLFAAHINSTVNPTWWELMTAFGTVGAVMTAVVVPLYQNWDRRREQRRNQLLLDWALSQEVYRLSSKLKAIGCVLNTSWEAPQIAEIDHLYAQLEIAKQSTIDSFGRLIIEYLLSEAIAMKEAINRRLQMSQGLIDQALANETPPSEHFQLQANINKQNLLQEMSDKWVRRVLFELNIMNLNPTNLVYGTGNIDIGLDVKEKAE